MKSLTHDDMDKQVQRDDSPGLKWCQRRLVKPWNLDSRYSSFRSIECSRAEQLPSGGIHGGTLGRDKHPRKTKLIDINSTHGGASS